MIKVSRVLPGMLPVLIRRYSAISGWAYLFSLATVVCLWWLIPTYSFVQRWSLNGVVTIEGFTSDHGILVTVDQGEGSIIKARLDLNDGSFIRVQQSVIPDYLLQMESRYQLQHTIYHASDRFEIIDTVSGIKSTVNIKDGNISIDAVYAGNSSSVSSSVSLGSSGKTAISPDYRWLLLTSRRNGIGRVLKNWLEDTFGLKPTFFPDGGSQSAVLFDLRAC